MIFVYAWDSPGSDLDGETFEIIDTTRACADLRAAKRTKETFSIASAERKAMTSFRFVAEYSTMRAYHRATEWA